VVGTVVGWADGVPAARQFATVDGRELRIPRRWDDVLRSVSAGGGGSVLFSGGSGLSSRQIGELAAASVASGVGLGFISGWGGEEDASRHSRKILDYDWCDSDETLIWSDEPLHGWAGTYGNCTILQGIDSRLVRSVNKAKRYTALTTHGNGIDAPVSTAILCSMLGPAGSKKRGPFLPCAEDIRLCLWSDHIGDGLRFSERLSPQDIVSDVLIFQTCYGALSHGALYHPSNSLASALLRTDSVGILLTTYKDTRDDYWPTFLALGLMSAGLRMGEVCRILNEASLDSGDGEAPWILFGDPEHRFETKIKIGDLTYGSLGKCVGLTPGVNLLRLPSVKPHVVTVELAGGAGSNPEIPVRQIPGSRWCVMPWLAGHCGNAKITATAAENDLRFKMLRSVRGSVAELAHTVSVLDRIDSDSRSRELVDVSELRKAVLAKLGRHREMQNFAVDYGVASDLSGTSRGSLKEHPEIGSWVVLNGALAHFLAAYAPAAPSINTFGTGRGNLVGKETCDYCGMVMDSRRVGPDLTSYARRMAWCAGCGLLADTCDSVSGVWLVGPGEIEPNRVTDYVLRVSHGRLSWSVVQCGLAIQSTPWGVRYSAPMSIGFLAESARTEIPMKITVDSDVPAGVYSLLAVIVANGDMWVCRRPVWIGYGETPTEAEVGQDER
jgi:hypothetical protein